MSLKEHWFHLLANRAFASAVRSESEGQLDRALIGFEKGARLADGSPELQADILTRAATLAHQLARLHQARDHLRRLVQLRPRDTAAWSLLGATLETLNERQDATLAWSRVVEVDPDHLPAHARLSELLLLDGRLEEAVSHVRALAEASPDDPASWIRLAQLMDKTGRSGDALSVWDRVLALRPGDINVHGHVADLRLSLGLHAEAVVHLRAMANARPGKAKLWRRLAVVLQDAGQPEGAVLAWRRLLDADPTSAEAHGQLIELFTAAGQVRETIVHRRALLEARPAESSLWRGLAEALDQIHAPMEAMAAWARVANLEPQAPDPVLRLAHCLSSLEDASEAALGIRALAEGALDGPGLLCRLARAFDSIDAKAQSAEAWSQVLALSPDTIEAHDRLSQLLTGLGRTAEATTHLRVLAERSPNRPKLWRRLAIALEGIGAVDGAIDAWRRLIEADADDQMAYERVTELLLRAGRKAEASVTMAEMVRLDSGSGARWRALAVLLGDLDDPQAEVGAWRSLLSLEPADEQAHARLADLLWDMGEKTDAIPHMEAVVARWPGRSKIWRRLALALLETGGQPEREVLAWRGLLSQVEDQQAHIRLAALLWDLDRKPDAVPHLRVTTILDRKRIKDWKRLGRCLALTGDDDQEAAKALRRTGEVHDRISVWKHVLALGPSDHEARRELANLFWEANRKVEAIPYLEAVCRSAPRDVKGWRRLATALGESGSADEEIRAWRSVLALNPAEARAAERMKVLGGEGVRPNGPGAPSASRRSRKPTPL